jgi:hypothetical protein
MSQVFGNRSDGDSRHDQPRSEHVLQIVPMKLFDSGKPAGFHKSLVGIYRG